MYKVLDKVADYLDSGEDYMSVNAIVPDELGPDIVIDDNCFNPDQIHKVYDKYEEHMKNRFDYAYWKYKKVNNRKRK